MMEDLHACKLGTCTRARRGPVAQLLRSETLNYQ